MNAQHSSNSRFRNMLANTLSIVAILAIAVPAVWSPAHAALPGSNRDDQPLETYQVNTADDNDDGACDETHCSLREAINASNADPGADTITFNIGEGGPVTIQPQGLLPQVTDPVTIDGTTQPGFDGSPIVELDGSLVEYADGLVISAGSSTVRGLVINRWQNVGILLEGSYETQTGGNLIEGNFVGTDISGSSAAANGTGIYALESSGNTVRGNLLSGNRGAGVGIRGVARENVVTGNRIGTTADGMSALPNTVGVLLEESATNNTVGGTSDEDRNLISGNSQDGVRIKDLDTNDNVVQGNYIGTDATGAAALPNGLRGVALSGAVTNNLIAGNVISGNLAAGVRLGDQGTTGNKIQGNYIGTDSTGTNALGNEYVGVRIADGATENLIGGPGTGNVISGNRAHGVLIDGEGTSGNFVQGNYIGTDGSGTTTISATAPPAVSYDVTVDAACPTYPAGTDIDGFVSQSDDPLAPWSGTSVTFQGTDDCPGADRFGEASLIYRYRIDFADVTQLQSIAVTGAAFNGPDNVLRVRDEDGNELAVAGTGGGNSYRTNYIILQGVSGKAFYLEEFDTSSSWRFRQSIVMNSPLPLGNGGMGVFLGSGATNNLVGGAQAAARNIISGNLENGVGMYDAGTTANTIEGNYIGTDLSGTQALGNASAGVAIGSGASGNLVGDIGAGNLISGNSDGVTIYDSGTNGNIVRSNIVGADLSGTLVLPNLGAGVWVGGGASDTVVGGTETGAANLISGNATHGVSINWLDTTGTRVLGNYIGTDPSGTLAVPNAAGGVFVSATQTWIGGTESGAGNLVSGNSGVGITLAEGAFGNFVQGNRIGTDATGTQPLANAYSGVWLDTGGTNNNLVGGTDPGAGNVIAFNTWAGIATAPDAGLSNAFLSNSIFSNGFGIDLAADGPTLNDVRDRDTGPNNLQNFPVLSRPKIVGGQLRVAGSLSTNANTTYRLEFFAVPVCDGSGYGQGQTFLGSGQVTTGAGGQADFSFLLSTNLPAGWLVTSTATNPDGNTSEFSLCAGPAK